MSITSLLKTFEGETEVKVTPDLKFVEKSAGGVSLKGVLQRTRAKFLREKKAWRIGKTFSPSTITYNYCRRIKVVQLAEKVDLYYEKHPPRQQNLFDIGNYLHEMVQNWFWDLGMLRGTFHCIKCKAYMNDYLSPTECPFCEAPRSYLEFKEIKMTNDEYKLSGRADMILADTGEPEEPVVDIKSIAARTARTPAQQFCFEDLDEEGPKEFHIVQVNLYLFMAGKKHGHLLYICKNDGRIKTFAVPYDFEVIKPYLEEIKTLLDLGERYKNGTLDKHELPDPCGRKDCPCEEYIVE